MSQRLLKGALNDACIDLAKQVLWSAGGMSNDIVETLAARFQEEALRHVKFIIGQNRDPNIITRAIHYLTDAHAIPPMGTDINWFRDMLSCVIELAVPNSGLTDKGVEFLKDVQAGVAESIESAAD